MSRLCIIKNTEIILQWPEGKWSPVSKILIVPPRELPNGQMTTGTTYDFSIMAADFPVGVIPQVCRATVKLPDGHGWMSAAACALTKHEAQKKAIAQVKRFAWMKLKRTKARVVVSVDGCTYNTATENGQTYYGSGPTMHTAYAAMCFNRIHVNRLADQLLEKEEAQEDEPPKRWSFWDWFRK